MLLEDGIFALETTVDPGGRIRVKVMIGEECVAEPTFAREKYSMVQREVLDIAEQFEELRNR